MRACEPVSFLWKPSLHTSFSNHFHENNRFHVVLESFRRKPSLSYVFLESFPRKQSLSYVVLESFRRKPSLSYGVLESFPRKPSLSYVVFESFPWKPSLHTSCWNLFHENRFHGNHRFIRRARIIATKTIAFYIVPD